MRRSSTLLLSALLPLASAYGPRAAAEKAAYYLTYVMEEAYGDPSKYTVAVGCVGTRKGGRCNLLEFCDYLWHDRVKEGGATYGDKKPPKENIIMNIPADADLDAVTIYNSIMGAKEKATAGGKATPLTKPGYGYVGAVDSDRLIGIPDWYQATVALGDSMRNAEEACNESEDTDKWEEFPERLEESSKLTIDMRAIDNAKVEMDEDNGLTKYTNGRYVDSVKYEPQSDIFYEVWPANVLQVDDESTVESWQVDTEGKDGKEVTPLSEEDAEALLKSARDKFNEADKNRHKMAIEAGLEMERRRGLRCDDSSSDDDSSSGSDSD